MSIEEFWRLTRLEHSIMLSVAVIVGEVIALARLPEAYVLLLSLLPPMLVGAASFAINDYFDLKSDKINKRIDRPLVRGKIKPRTAAVLSLIFFLAGIILSAFLNWKCFIITLLFSVLAYLYSFRLKDIALVGNAYVASTMAVPFIYGNLAVAAEVSPVVVLLGSIAFVSGLAREIMKTVMDVRGDRKGRGSRTLPVSIGVRSSLMLSSALYLISILLSFAPYVYIVPYARNLSYIVPIIIADILFAYIAVFSIKETSADLMKKSRNVSLAAMFIALLGFLLALLPKWW